MTAVQQIIIVKKTEKQTKKWKKQQQAGLQEAREYCEGEGEVPARKKRRWQYRNWNMVVEIEQMHHDGPFSSPTEGREVREGRGAQTGVFGDMG